MKSFLIVILLLISITSFAQKEQDKLMNAYKNESRELLKEFMNEWCRKTDSCINSQKFEPLQKEVTELYVFVIRDSIQAKISDNSFSSLSKDTVSSDYSKLTSYFFNNLYYKDRYLTIPERVSVSICKFVNGKNTEKKLQDTSVIFAPRFDIENLRLLHVNKTYSKAINRFLGARSYYSKEERKKRPFIKYSEVQKRIKFIKQELDIQGSHWGDCWLMTANPYVYHISFNQEISLAEVSISTSYCTGVTVLFKKLSDKWCFEKFVGEWIE